MKTPSRAPQLVVWASLAVTGCKGCSDEKPYTPFSVTSSLPVATPSASASEAPPVPSGGSAELAVRKAVLAPAGARQFRSGDRDLQSPPGRVFEQLVDSDFDGDGSVEVAAWTALADDAQPGAAPGELWLYPANGDPKKIFDFPGFVPTGPDCRHTTELSLPGKRLLSVDTRAVCTSARLARSATRALALVDPFEARAPRFGLRVADAAPGETLKLQLLTADEDADGREDFRLTTSLATTSPDVEATTSVVWLDRALGVSRDPREPARTLEALLSKELPRARQKKTAESARARVEAVRRLLGSLCAEGKVPRVFDWDGAPLRCGSLTSVVDRAGAIEVAAALALSDVPAALSALTRDGWYFGAMSERQRTALVKDIEKKTTAVPAARITLGARPRRTQPASFSPLTFAADGSLLVQTDSGLYRLAPDSAREEPVTAESGATRWPVEVVRGSTRLLGVSYSCDRSEIELLLAGAAASSEATNLLSPRPGVCGGQPFRDGFPIAAVSVQDGLELLIGGVLVGPRGAAAPPGSPRSADGKWIAIPTPLGLLIHGERSEIWKIDGWEPAAGCVVASGAARAACIRRGVAELYLKSP